MASTPDLKLVNTELPTLNDLLDEYDNWRGTLDYDSDEFGAIRGMTALYRFALTNRDEPGSDLLLRAILAVENRLIEAHDEDNPEKTES